MLNVHTRSTHEFTTAPCRDTDQRSSSQDRRQSQPFPAFLCSNIFESPPIKDCLTTTSKKSIRREHAICVPYTKARSVGWMFPCLRGIQCCFAGRKIGTIDTTHYLSSTVASIYILHWWSHASSESTSHLAHIPGFWYRMQMEPSSSAKQWGFRKRCRTFSEHDLDSTFADWPKHEFLGLCWFRKRLRARARTCAWLTDYQYSRFTNLNRQPIPNVPHNKTDHEFSFEQPSYDARPNYQHSFRTWLYNGSY